MIVLTFPLPIHFVLSIVVGGPEIHHKVWCAALAHFFETKIDISVTSCRLHDLEILLQIEILEYLQSRFNTSKSWATSLQKKPQYDTGTEYILYDFRNTNSRSIWGLNRFHLTQILMKPNACGAKLIHAVRLYKLL